MNYLSAILEHLIDIYERRGLYHEARNEKRQGAFLYVQKVFPEYGDSYDGMAYQEINEAIESLRQQEILLGKKDARGNYNRLQLDLEKIELCHQLIGRPALGKIRQAMLALLRDWDVGSIAILTQFRTSQLDRLEHNKTLEFGIADDLEKLRDVMQALTALMALESETYVRNFSEAVFADSKRFQKIRGHVEGILCAYGGQELTRKTVLSTFNLLDNPTYILLKGNLRITFDDLTISIVHIPGGIALPSVAVSSIRHVEMDGRALITVENLTTFHDEPICENAILYLGGFHNTVRTELLKKIYERNPQKAYYHKGDIDVYGFLILENLKSKTKIPFIPLEMDVATLQECEQHQLVKPLSTADKKMLHLPQLMPYQDVLSYMEQHNCKAEQESMHALNLFQKSD